MSKILTVLGSQANVEMNGNLNHTLGAAANVEMDLDTFPGKTLGGLVRLTAFLNGVIYRNVVLHATMSLYDSEGNVLAKEDMKFSTKAETTWSNIPVWKTTQESLTQPSNAPSGRGLKGINLFAGTERDHANPGQRVNINTTEPHSESIWPSTLLGQSVEEDKHPNIAYKIAPDTFSLPGRMEIELFGKSDMPVEIQCAVLAVEAHTQEEFLLSNSTGDAGDVLPADNIPSKAFQLTFQGAGAVRVSIPVKVESI